MKRLLSNALLFLLLTAGLSGQDHSKTPPATPAARPAYGEKLKRVGIPNGGRMSDFLFRGAQPQSEGLQELKKLGVTTIVDLRGEDPGRIEWERQQSEALGLHFVNIPVSGWSPPSNAQVAQFLSLFRTDPKQKVFVHCRFGDDRTGVFVATYRMAYEGWSASQAMNEMYFFGFNGFWHPSMKTFIRDFPNRLKTDPALEAFHPGGPLTK
jgi:tyrosine-protein phosphatase SIW14